MHHDRPPWGRPPANRSATPRPDLRIGDAERTAVTEALQRHYAEGRLDGAELEERLERALAARTEGDLAEIVRDLPGPLPWAPAAPHRGRPARRRRPGSRLLASVLLLGAVLLVAAVVTGFSALLVVVRILFLVFLFGLFFRHLRRIR